MSKELKIGVVNQGMLQDETERFLNDAGIKTGLFPMDGRSLVQMLQTGDLNTAIVGWEDFFELNPDLEFFNRYSGQSTGNSINFVPLGFGFRNLYLRTNRDRKIKSWALDRDLKDARIATGFPRALGRFLSGKNITAEIVPLETDGPTAIELGLADAVVDMQRPEDACLKSGLSTITCIGESRAIALANPESILLAGQKTAFEQFWDRIIGQNNRILSQQELRRLNS